MLCMIYLAPAAILTERINTMKLFPLLLAVASVSLIVLLAGCGSGGSGSAGQTPATGVTRVTVVWPTRSTTVTSSRFIPQAANSIVVQINNGAGFTASQVLSRPANGSPSTATFTLVPVGSIAVTVNAYASTDGSGVSEAVATTTAQSSNHQTTIVNVDMTSTITSVSISQYPSSINVTDTVQLLATALDANNNIVPVQPQPNGFYWTTSNTAVATVDQTGLLTAKSAGTVTVTAMESETGISGSVSLQINPANGTLAIVIENETIVVSVTPASASVASGGTQQFTATVAGIPNQAVIWSVQEANGGTISATGLYTAPTTAGTYHIVATAIANQTITGVATATVTNSLTYSIQQLGAGAASALNDAGQVVGTNQANHAFLWTSSAGMQDFGTSSHHHDRLLQLWSRVHQ